MMRTLPRDVVTVTLVPRSALHDFVEGVELDKMGGRGSWSTAQLPPQIRSWINRAMASAPRDTVVIITDGGRTPMIGAELASTTFRHA